MSPEPPIIEPSIIEAPVIEAPVIEAPVIELPPIVEQPPLTYRQLPPRLNDYIYPYFDH